MLLLCLACKLKALQHKFVCVNWLAINNYNKKAWPDHSLVLAVGCLNTDDPVVSCFI